MACHPTFAPVNNLQIFVLVQKACLIKVNSGRKGTCVCAVGSDASFEVVSSSFLKMIEP